MHNALRGARTRAQSAITPAPLRQCHYASAITPAPLRQRQSTATRQRGEPCASVPRTHITESTVVWPVQLYAGATEQQRWRSRAFVCRSTISYYVHSS